GDHHRKKDQIKIAFGKQLKSKREERGFTQDELAQKAHLDPITIAFLEQGVGNVSLDTLITFAQVLSISLKDLMPDRV
ncbi:MAG: helix-turn-helix transcriptional regulator, partial [Verrucomicrobia bacterium]|nr:helix-turn-helix transcriptional regulator [Verrucomicrobiota bacterium]